MRLISQDFVMKKKFLLSLLLTLLLLSPAINAFAGYYKPVNTEIAFEIKNGGTAVIIPEVNCPVPDKTELKLSHGETGRFNICFDETGVYTYTVKNVPDKRKLIFDDSVYTVKIYVNDEGGKLVTTVIAYTDGNKYSSRGGVDFGPERLLFANRKPEEPKPPEEPTEPSTDGKTPSRKNRNPKTGDDSRMELYFLIAMIASAGLLALSVAYMIDTEKMLREKDNK